MGDEQSSWDEFHDAVQCGDMGRLERLLGRRPTEEQSIDLVDGLLSRPISSWMLFHAGWIAASLAAREPGPDVSRLLAAAKFYQSQRPMFFTDGLRSEDAYHGAAIAEYEAARK